MTISVGPLLDSVSTTLLDTARRTWPLQSDLVPYLNEALAATAAIKPDMYTRQEFMTLVAGVSQVIPSDGVALLDVIYDQGTGRVVTQVDAGLLDEANRFWPSATQEVGVQHFAADPRDPRRFNVTPPNTGAGSVQILYGAVPTVTGSSGEDIPISPNFMAPLISYVLFKCYAKNSKKQDLTKAGAYKNDWGSMLGLKTKAQVAVAPKVAVSEGVQ
jgi:hypothetical protein